MTALWIVTLMALAEVLGITLLLHYVPTWSRPEIYFALTVPASFRNSEEGRSILRRYRRRLWAGTVLVGIVGTASLLLHRPPGEPGPAELTLVVLAPTLILITWAWAYLAARREVAPTAVSPTAASPTTEVTPDETPGVRETYLTTAGERGTLLVGGWIGQLGPFALLAAMGAYLAWRWEDIPHRFITHWGPNLEPDAWAAKTPIAVALPLVLGALFCLLLVLLLWGISRGSRWALPAPGAGQLIARRRRAIGWMLLTVNYFLAVIFAAVAASPLIQTSGQARLFLVLILTVSILGPLLMLVVWFLRFGKEFSAASRGAEAQAVEGAAPLGDRTADRHWKGGLIYYNPQDPALWVEKRFGIGYTLNMARPGAWWFLGAVLVLPIAVALLTIFLSGG